MFSDKRFGLSSSLIAATRGVLAEAEDKEDKDKSDPKMMKGGKTKVDLEPKTDDDVREADVDKKKSVKEGKEHTVPKTDKEKKLASLAHPKDKITHKDVLVGRGVIAKEEVEIKEIFKFFKKKEKEPELKRFPDSHEANDWMSKKVEHAIKHKPKTAHNLFDPSSGDYMPKDVHVGSSWKPEHQEHYRSLKKKHPELVKKAKESFKTSGQYSQSRVGDNQDFDSDVKLREEAEIEEAKVTHRVGAKAIKAVSGKVTGDKESGKSKWSELDKKEKELMNHPDANSGKFAKELDKLTKGKTAIASKHGLNAFGEEVELSAEELARIEAIAQSLDEINMNAVMDRAERKAGAAQYKELMKKKAADGDEAAKRWLNPSLRLDKSSPTKPAATKEEYELDEAKPTIVSAPIRGANQDQSGENTKSVSGDYTISDSKKMKKEEVELDEAKRGRPKKNPTPDDEQDEHEHVIMQLRKVVSTHGALPVKHLDGKSTKITPQLAQHALNKHSAMKTAAEKQDFETKMHKSHDSMKSALGQ